MSLPPVLHDLLSLPTAPYCEAAVIAYLQDTVGRVAGVTITYDRYGNLLARYRRQPRHKTPLAFVAHTDHPGFVARRMPTRRTLRADFRGGVRPEYFPDAKVRFWHDGRWVKGRVLKLTVVEPPAGPGRPPTPKEAHLEISRPVPPGTLGMWDLPGPALRGDKVVARACDDLAGVAAMVALLQRLSRTHARADVYCLFTRAEEVGFVGALGAIRARTLPRRVPAISIETSSTLVHAPIGAGPIVRVGDRLSIYTPALVGFCMRVAQALSQRSKGFAFQRKLMDGGACEATAFANHGYAAAGICLALGNYHNMDTRRKRIGSEWVSLDDWQRMVDLFEALALDEQGPQAADESTRARLDKLFAEGEPLLQTEGGVKK